MASRDRLDVLYASDLRLPGGTSASIAEEVRAGAAGGWVQGLLSTPSRLVAGERGLARPVRGCLERGEAHLVVGRDPVRCRLLVLRHPTAFEATDRLPPVAAEQVVMVANQSARDGDGLRYDPVDVDEAVRRWTGTRPVWSPIGPVARESLSPWRDRLRLAEQDWVNVMAVDEWVVPRSGLVGDVPVLGRHSRPQPAKWPTDPSVLRAAYAVDVPGVRVEVLGGAGPAEDLLGRRPRNWGVLPFGARAPREWLRGVDVWVYFHSPAWREAYGRAIMEALASGAVVVLPEYLRPVFGDAALYVEPDEVVALARRLHADPDAFLEQSRRGQDYVSSRGHDVHRARLSQRLAGDGGGGEVPHASGPVARPGPRPAAVAPSTRVLFITSNGAGMGHLTRLLAVARRLGEGYSSHFLSLSSAAPVVAQEGATWEYCPSAGALGGSKAAWNAVFAERLELVMRTYAPRAVVFDGTWPYASLLRVRERHPGTVFVWSRRAMWKPDVGPGQLDAAGSFELVVEPGEFAAAYDTGATTRRADARRVDPVTLLDPEEHLPRAEARRELGLDPAAPALLLTLGAGNINDIGTDAGAVRAALDRLPGGWQLGMTRPPIAARDHVPAGVHQVQVYPLARYLPAFDAAVSASGYNSFHELLQAGLPTLWVPNEATATDDQVARARFAADTGVGLVTRDLADDAPALLERLADEDERTAVRARLADAYPGNGAGEVARLVREACAS